MAGGKGGRGAAGWFAGSRTVVLLAVGVLALLVLGSVAALVVDTVEVTGPQFPFQDSCEQGNLGGYLIGSGYDRATCQWRKALSRGFARTVLLQVDEAKSGAFYATATITTVAADPLVTMIQRGDAQDANTFTFFSTAVGYVVAGNNTFNWSPPTVTINNSGAKAVISTTGQPSDQPPIPRAVQLEFLPGFGASKATTVRVSTQNRVIAGVSRANADSKVVSESARSLTVDIGNGELRVDVRPGSPQPSAGSPSLAGARWIARAASTAWRLLRGYAGMLVPAGAWIAMLLATRMGAFGTVGRGAAWRRMEQVLGTVVIAHLVISACFQLSVAEGNLASSLLDNSSLQQRLSSAMLAAGLWSPNGYTAVDGGTILLIALAIVTVGRGPREAISPPSGRSGVITAIALAAAAAVMSGYVVLAHNDLIPIGSHVIFGDGPEVRIASHPPLAVEICVASVSALLVVFLAAVWIYGGGFAGISPSGGLRGRAAARIPRTRCTIGCLALVAAAALTAVGIAAAIAHHLPGQSGTTEFIGCLVAAAAFVLVAAVASRPWRATSFLNRRYGIVPLIATLAIAAGITSGNGYGPAALRWGGVIIVGSFLGIVVARLVVAATGPLGPPVSRPPHLLAVIVAAAAIAVPWGDLGHDVQVGWWDLLTYASRIDGVLPLVLVAAGVTSLRRLGLVLSRDKAMPSARRLGIAAWIVALSGSYAFGSGADLADAAALASAAVAAWLLMPRGQVRRASVILGQSEQDVARAVRRAVEMGVARRTLPGLAKTMREEVAAGKTSFVQAQQEVATLERRAAGRPGVVATLRPGATVMTDERAFGTFISIRPWERARWGMGYGAIAGAPWILLGLAGASVPLDQPEGYPELALISAVAPLLLRWVGYGLLFGYFFPLLRGRTGLGKSVSFFAAAAVPSILGTLAGPHATNQQWHSAAVLAVELLIFAITMGLLADLAVLRKYGFAPGRLVDVHSLWTISAWASSITVAVATGIATIILAGLQPFVTGVITPSPASTPPAAASHP